MQVIFPVNIHRFLIYRVLKNLKVHSYIQFISFEKLFNFKRQLRFMHIL